MRRIPLILAVLSLVGCGPGDNSAVRAFHSTVQPGDALSELMAEGEKAQLSDLDYSVSARGCAGDELFVQRGSQEPSIRVSNPAPDKERPWEQAYHEIGYATREDFARGLAQIVPAFYSCKEFRFSFFRSEGWPSSDSFTVTVDTEGKVTSVSALQEDRLD